MGKFLLFLLKGTVVLLVTILVMALVFYVITVILDLSIWIAFGVIALYWSGETDAITKIRSELNGIIGIDSTVSLVNSSVKVKDKSSLRRINLISIIVMVLVVLCTVLVSLLYNDYLNSHNEIWLEVLRHLLQDH